MTERMTATGPTPEQAFLTARVIFFALAFSPLTFGVIAWFVVDGGLAAFVPDGSVGLYAWAGLTMGGFLLWRFAWGRARELLSRLERDRLEGDVPGTLGALQSRLLLAWVGAEAAGIAGAVALLLSGSDLLLFASLLFAGLLHHVSRPRRAWYSELAPPAGAGSFARTP